MCEEPVIDQGSLITVAPFRVARTCYRIMNYGDLKTLFQQLAQVGFDAHICQHTAQDYPRYPPLSKLQDQIIRLGPTPCAG